ncbi:MAG: lycopene cyclase domain-containing protein [Nannocystaceae bacterium]|nr:lycopene cyclase domain-containing protein [Nannocystaceae bacterium]
MAAEYLLFDLFVAAPILTLWLLRPQWLRDAAAPALRAVLWGALPFVLWDAAVVGRHWWFEPTRVLGPAIAGLPLEELGFFVVVPLACLLTWELVTYAGRPQRATRAWAALAAGPLALAAIVALWFGREYTALAAAALVLAIGLDEACGTAVLRTRAGRDHVLVVVGLTTVFNGYLTARPIVHYDERFTLGLRVGTVPLEDYGFGLALVLVTTVLYQHARGRALRPSWPARAIRARLGGYRQLWEAPPQPRDASPRPCRVAVIGGGLAGLSAAELLSRRGVAVTLFERGATLGGKLAAWRDTLPGGFEAPIEHGFHAFFRHYYNLSHWLDELGLRRAMRPIDEYAILGRHGERAAFAAQGSAPGLNLLQLRQQGMFRLRDVVRPRTGRALELLLRFDADHPDPALDQLSFAQWADDAALPPTLRMVFTSFARAFFAAPDRISMAELVRSFHFYYLSHDHGLIYDYLDGSYDEALVDPIAARLRAAGVELRLGHAIGTIAPHDHGLAVDGERFDHVILAADATAAARVLAASPQLGVSPSPSMRAGQRYAVLRVWCEGVIGDELPVFVVTDGVRLLDAVAFVDRTDPRAQQWRQQRGGSVLELHCYAVPDDVPSDAVAAGLLDELATLLPGGRTLRVVHSHLQLRDDFTALHVGMQRERPGVASGHPRLWFAGDWVALPIPAMLMEAAHTSARLAVNRICEAEGREGFPVWTVPRRGLLARRAA